jgi:hypothetical protein
MKISDVIDLLEERRRKTGVRTRRVELATCPSGLCSVEARERRRALLLESEDNLVGKVYAGRRGTQTLLEKYTAGREGEEDNSTHAGRTLLDAALIKTRSEKLRHARQWHCSQCHCNE